jgi:hypothetical protein
MLSVIIASGFAGFTISTTGNYWYILVTGPWLLSVGGGLLYTLREHSSNGKYIGYQVRRPYEAMFIGVKDS